MKSKTQQIGLGGGCHWCTEAVFQSLLGVTKVQQGFIASEGENNSYSEAVIVHFDPKIISLNDLIEIHLHTHKSTSEHSMRSKYRSAIYYSTIDQQKEAMEILTEQQVNFDQRIITKVMPFCNFKESSELFRNYYYSNPEKPFCERHINPKLSLLLNKYQRVVNMEKLTRKETQL